MKLINEIRQMQPRMRQLRSDRWTRYSGRWSNGGGEDPFTTAMQDVAYREGRVGEEIGMNRSEDQYELHAKVGRGWKDGPVSLCRVRRLYCRLQ